MDAYGQGYWTLILLIGLSPPIRALTRPRGPTKENGGTVNALTSLWDLGYSPSGADPKLILVVFLPCLWGDLSGEGLSGVHELPDNPLRSFS